MTARKMAKKLKESELVEEIGRFLAKEGYIIKLEVPTMGRRADIVAIIKDSITIVEAKINHKKKVLEQCGYHDIVADYICIAWGGKNIPPSLFGDARELGYGIIHFSFLLSQCYWAIKPKPNENFWEPQKHVLIRSMEQIDDATY